MTYAIQQGPWTVKQLITDYLSWDLPRRIKGFRDAWQMDDERLPSPVHYLAYEPPALDEWPTIITVQMSTSRIQRIDYTGGLNPVYRCTYNLRTYVWVNHEFAQNATEGRDRLTAVLRTSLLDRPCLEKGTSHSNHQLLLDESSLREEYSEITYVKGHRAIAGAYLSYDVSLDEVIARADLGTVGEIDVQMDALSRSDGPDVANVLTRIITD